MVIGALSVLAPISPLRAKLAKCGKRNPASDSREFCRSPLLRRVHTAAGTLAVPGAAVAGVAREWLTNEDIVAPALWRDRQSVR